VAGHHLCNENLLAEEKYQKRWRERESMQIRTKAVVSYGCCGEGYRLGGITLSAVLFTDSTNQMKISI